MLEEGSGGGAIIVLVMFEEVSWVEITVLARCAPMGGDGIERGVGELSITSEILNMRRTLCSRVIAMYPGMIGYIEKSRRGCIPTHEVCDGNPHAKCRERVKQAAWHYAGSVRILEAGNRPRLRCTRVVCTLRVDPP